MADANNAGGGGAGGPPGQVIVVKKKNRGGGHGHHGGAWKVAYADFVTAMMAFFLLLWLLAVSTEEQKVGIAYYFNPPSNASQFGGGSGIMGGDTPMDVESIAPTDSPPVPPTENAGEDLAVQAKEDAMFRAVAEEMKKAVMNIPQLKAMMENLLVDVTPEGLRISITDAAGRELFAEGSAEMNPLTEQLLGVLGGVLSKLPNKLALGGHTDSVPYRGARAAQGYDNWNLSADRAQAMRRVLTVEGVPERRIQRVAGFAASEPLLPDEPTHVKNRRLTIIVLRSKRGVVAQFSQDGLLAPPTNAPVLEGSPLTPPIPEQ
ncbi:MAG: OmpA family protein [Alphaproteobacteria bacterium]|nr:OmpA family protein [Alphaproteobacteria bacterium]